MALRDNGAATGAATRDVQIEPSREEFASPTALRKSLGDFRGVCITHGAKVKRCSFEGCANGAINGGVVCITHGAGVKRCSFKGCTNVAKRGGVCVCHTWSNKRNDASIKDVPMEQ
jgi:hypothetical protein